MFSDDQFAQYPLRQSLLPKKNFGFSKHVAWSTGCHARIDTSWCAKAGAVGHWRRAG